MPEWTFEPLPPTFVEQEPTQRDQFNNDEVGLADALVREVIQNSTDAPSGGGVVKVRFDLVDLDSDATTRLRMIMESLRPHLVASGVRDSALDEPKARLLVIEDFNTTGLTGATDALDNDNFRNFWRRHGKSEKTGRSLGRWGLGKLVYSSSSLVHSFFGLTMRVGDLRPLLFGQAVLQNHSVGGIRYPAHGFWFTDRAESGLQLPITDEELIEPFVELAGLQRGNSSGLSIIVPYPLPGLTESDLVSGVVHNYYFPILAGQLEVEVGTQLLDKSTFLETAQTSVTDIPLNFVAAVSQALASPPNVVLTTLLPENGLAEEHFPLDELAELRALFASGSLLKVRVPVWLQPTQGSPIESFVDLFLQKPAQSGESYSLFVRGSLTIPGERRSFSGVPAYGAMIASDTGVVGFLGDAENPAHTSWNSNAEKLSSRWLRPNSALKPIRGALRALYQFVGEDLPQTHENALRDFFSIVDAIPSKGRTKKKPPAPAPVIEPRERAMVIQHRKGGFAIVAGPGAAGWSYPRIIRVRTAYDLISGNPFKRHSNFDFDLRNEIEIDTSEAEIEPIASNVLRIKLLGPQFHISAAGFDEHRDLVVEARTVP
jgi:hypothetical protein